MRSARLRQCRSSRLTAGTPQLSSRVTADSSVRSWRSDSAAGSLACCREVGACRLVRPADCARRHTHYQIARDSQHGERYHGDDGDALDRRYPFDSELDGEARYGREKMAPEKLSVQPKSSADHGA